MSSQFKERVLFYRQNKTSENSDASDIWDDTALIDAYDKAVNNAYVKIANRRRRRTTNSVEVNSDVSTTMSESSGTRDAHKPKSTGKYSKGRAGDINKMKSSVKWKVGDACRAKYDVDGLTYEAKVMYINYEKQSCRVTFVGYGNVETVNLVSLEPSLGERTALGQMIAAAAVDESQRHNDNELIDDGEKYAEIEVDTGLNRRQYEPQQHEPDTRRFKPSSSGEFRPSSRNAAPSFSGRFTSLPFPPPPPFVIDAPAEEDEALANMLMSWYMNGYHSGYYQGLKHGRMRDSSTNNQRHSSSRM